MLSFLIALAMPSPVATAREVSFVGHGGFQLKGELMLPSGEGKFPAILLMPGSGPTDRNGNQPPILVTDVLKQIAEDMAQNGIATFRFDKRAAHVYKDAWPKPETFGEFFSWTPFVEDALAAYRAMAAQKEVDAARLGVAGHSEGGSIALALHGRFTANETPKATVLLAAPGRKIDAVLDDQITRALRVQKVPAEMSNTIMANLRETTKAIAATGQVPSNVHPGLRALFPPYIGAYYRGWINFDPVDTAKNAKGAFLVVNGALDIQISPERDAKALHAALATRTGGVQELLILTGTSHNLKKVQSESEPGFAGPLTPEFLDAFRKFAKARL